jgi:alpha-tubulin suppressor-like RCC1 family protein
VAARRLLLALLIASVACGRAEAQRRAAEDRARAAEEEARRQVAAAAAAASASATGSDDPAESSHDPQPLVEVTVGHHHACGRTEQGAVYCWGRGALHQLGRTISGSESTTPLRVVGVADAVSVSAGQDRTCAVEKDGTVWCWGTDGIAVPGLLDQTVALVRPTPIQGIEGAVQVALGLFHALALLRDGTVMGWGIDSLDGGVLVGLEPLMMHVRPERLAGVTRAKRIATGQKSACAVLADGAVSCWGSGAFWPKHPLVRAPTPVPGVAGAVDVGVGSGFACALLGDHTVRCWGENDYGQLAIDTTTPVDHVVRAHVADVAALHVRGSSACAVNRGGALLCWGANGLHQLGVTGGAQATPYQHTQLTGVVAADIDGRACAATSSPELYCWGEDAWSPARVPW